MNKIKKLTKHEKEMQAMQEYHKKVMADPELRAKLLIASGAFYKTSDGKLEIVEGYKHLFEPKAI